MPSIFSLLSAADLASDQRAGLPAGVEAYRVSGPLFFAVANRLDDVLRAVGRPPRVFILRMRLVPMIDASGIDAIENLVERCRRHGTLLVLSGLQAQPREALARMGMRDDVGGVRFANDFPAAIEIARAGVASESASR